MKLSYGVRGHYVPIPLEDRVIGPIYNEQFGDPCPHVPKHIVISGLIRPLYVREGTPLTVAKEGKGNLYVVTTGLARLDYPVIEVTDSLVPRLVELISLSDPNAIIAVIPRLPSSCIGEYLRLLLVEEWRNNLKIMRHLRSIEMLCYQHTSEGKPVRGVFWIRGSYVRERVGQDWLQFSHPSIQCCDLAVSVYSHGFISDYPLSIGGGPCEEPPLLSQEYILGISPTRYQLGNQHGLFNQLCNIANGITVAHFTGRKLASITFRPHYVDLKSVPLGVVLDTSALGSVVKRGYRTALTQESEPEECPPGIDSMDTLLGPWQRVYKILRGIDRPAWIKCSLPRVFSSIEAMSLLRILPPSKMVFEVVEAVASQLRDFVAIHLRLEDDWIFTSHLSATPPDILTDSLWRNYTNLMAEMMTPDTPCYICTHLGKSPNRNNYLLDTLKQMYPRAITCPPWRDRYDLPEGREVDALIDYLVCLRANKFIGVNNSTFSLVVSIILSSYGRQVALF